ncbi:aminopeptidase [Patiriisocius marinistellae]|uniref:Aminopeptidase N n=2 Tax=Patiriisocius marinistellae TaxID=2494560 RepID=A0A5J4FZI1_9FLAO|nr:aminopeptidase [Patiriisocius marinistellae]
MPNASEMSVNGDVFVSFTILKDIDKVYLDAINMERPDAKDGDTKIYYTDDKIIFHNNFKAGNTYEVNFQYVAKPKKALYFTGDHIWTQGQGKNTSHWLPSIDDMNDKIEFDLKYVVPETQTILSNGILVDIIRKDNFKEYFFDMENPMSSYLVAFAMGDYNKTTVVSASGIPIELYYRPNDSAIVKTTYKHTKTIFDYLENEIDVPYPWQNYKQVPVRDFLYAGMENTSCTIFSESFVVDEIGINDRDYTNVNAHELAHQWFGNLVTETSGTHHWLQEGFATYYALLAEREIYGDDYYYWKLLQSANSLQEVSEAGKGQSLLDPKASSLTFYEKGAWALHILRERIGDTAFKNTIKQYLEEHAFKNVETDNFLNMVKRNTTITIDNWEKDWLQQTAFQANQAYESLLASPFIKEYFELSSLRPVAIAEKKIPLTTALTFNNEYLGQEAVFQLTAEPVEKVIPYLKKAFESNNLMTRQAIAISYEGAIPNVLKADFESLLNDESYVTIEAALLLLRKALPNQMPKYLDKTKGIVGFQDKNVRQIWLVLAMLTEGYQKQNAANFTSELNNYTSNNYSFEIREKAFEYVNYLGIFDDTSLASLVNASTHHYWRFRDSARTLLTEVLKEEKYSNKVKEIYSQFSDTEKEYLERIGFKASEK